MSLLEEGIATGNVLPTGRKEKHSIDLSLIHISEPTRPY